MAEPGRYARQQLYAGVGADGQEAIAGATALIVGLGALGSAAADVLARAGVGTLRIVDRDILELTNLQRQVLYSEDDLASGLPKAEAARRRLGAVNSEIRIEAEVLDLGPDSITRLVAGATVVVDGTDNFETRLLINDACLKLGVPWVYTGVIGATIHSFPVVPGDGPCFRCYLGEAPAPGSVETCDTAGVLGPAVLTAVGLGSAEALKVLAGRRDALVRGLRIVDLWSGRMSQFSLAVDPDCPACAGRYDYLEGARAIEPARLCGRNAIQLPGTGRPLELESLASSLAAHGEVKANRFLLRFQPADWPEGELTVFRDGRRIVKGTEEVGRARSISAKYLGA